jgi:hypothetical protein
MKYRAGNRIKLKLFATEYAGEARSGNPAPQAAASHTVRDCCCSGGGRLRASCGRALQIFPEAMTDNIDESAPLRVVSVRRAVGEAHRLHVKIVAA